MTKKIDTIFRVLFLITAISAIVTPILLILSFKTYLVDAFSGSDSLMYISIFIVLLVIFGLIFSYMFYNYKKENFTIISRIFTVLLFPLLISASIYGGVYYASIYVSDVRGPYLSWTEDPKTSMTITFELKTKGDYQVRYADSLDKLENDPTTASFIRSAMRSYDNYYHYVVYIKNLNPGTRYYYTIPGLQDNAVSFRTAPAKSLNTTAKYKFILYGDSRETSRLNNQHYQIIKQISRKFNISDIAFVINTGDLALRHDDIAGWNFHFDAIRNLANQVPYFVASGNHEWDTSQPWYDTAHQPAIDIEEYPFKNDSANDVYTLNETSYAFGYGDAYFIFIGYPHLGSNESIYRNWLNEQLKIGNSSYEFTFVSFHRPPFDNREDIGDENTVKINPLEVQMLHLGGVDAVFNGHNHVLAVQNITYSGDPISGRNVTYIISGAGGASLRKPMYDVWTNASGAEFYGRTVFAEEIYHFFLVEVDPTTHTAKFTCYDLNGNQVFDPIILKSYK
ncbi:MAG: fibronectin type III domain-containing protein [Promethearchaeota archaeon]